MLGGEQGRRVGLALLVQFAPQLLLPLPGQAPLLGEQDQWLSEGTKEGESHAVWQLLRDCLVSCAHVPAAEGVQPYADCSATHAVGQSCQQLTDRRRIEGLQRGEEMDGDVGKAWGSYYSVPVDIAG